MQAPATLATLRSPTKSHSWNWTNTSKPNTFAQPVKFSDLKNQDTAQSATSALTDTTITASGSTTALANRTMEHFMFISYAYGPT